MLVYESDGTFFRSLNCDGLLQKKRISTPLFFRPAWSAANQFARVERGLCAEKDGEIVTVDNERAAVHDLFREEFALL